MTILECMTDGYLLATGKATLPDSGSSKYNRLFALAKKLHRDWQNEPGVDWNSLHQTVEAGTVSTATEYELDTEILKLSKRKGDRVHVRTTDDTDIFFTVVDPSRLYEHRYGNAVALVGQTLRFSRAFDADESAYGGTVRVPAYVKLDDITSVNDDVLVDNPDWLSAAIAAYFVMPDAQLNYQYPDLVAQANQLMTTMKENNGTFETYADDEDFFSGVDS